MKFTFWLSFWLHYVFVVILLKKNFLLTDIFALKSLTILQKRLILVWNDKRRPTINLFLICCLV